MPYAFLFFIAFLAAGSGRPQNRVADSLEKYSYYLFGRQNSKNGSFTQSVEGTCFFVRSAGKTFLVSAKHLMSSWSASDSSKPALYPDTMFIRIPAAGDNGFIYYPLDIREIKMNVQGSYYYREPDIFVSEFTDTGTIRVNAIEPITVLNPPRGLSASAIIYGFPPLSSDRLDNPAVKNSSSLRGRLASSPEENISYRDNTRKIAVRDTINYLIKTTGTVQRGYSGAPVFLENDGTGEWYFAGIVSQGVPEDNYFIVVKPGFLDPAIIKEAGK